METAKWPKTIGLQVKQPQRSTQKQKPIEENENATTASYVLAQRDPTTGPRMEFVQPAEQFCTSFAARGTILYKQRQLFFLKNAMILGRKRNFVDRFQLKTFFFFF